MKTICIKRDDDVVINETVTDSEFNQFMTLLLNVKDANLYWNREGDMTTIQTFDDDWLLTMENILVEAKNNSYHILIQSDYGVTDVETDNDVFNAFKRLIRLFVQSEDFIEGDCEDKIVIRTYADSGWYDTFTNLLQMVQKNSTEKS